MNRIYLLTLALLGGIFYSASAQPEVVTTHQIDSVTVYLEGAMVYRSFTAQVPAGESAITFEGLTHTLEGSSIVVGLQENLTPQSVTVTSQPWNPYGEEVYFTMLTDSLDGLQWEFEAIGNEIQALEEEQVMLQENRQVSGGNTGVSLERLQQISNYLRERTLAIQRRLSELRREQRTWSRQIALVQTELNRYRRGIPQTRKDLSFVVRSQQAQRVHGTLAYYVKQANWNAAYDIKVADLESDLRIDYKADLYNGTYEDWNQVRVKVSTATPNLDVTLPSLTTWRLYPNQFDDRRQANFMQNTLPAQAMMDSEAGSTAGSEVVEAGEFAVEFRIAEPINLAGTYEQRVFPLTVMNTPALYQHFAIPKLGKEVYLIARIPGWNRLNLLSGKASVYFNGQYTGQSNINIRNVRDTLEFSLGEDPQVLVSRKLAEDFTERISLGSKRRMTKGYTLFVKNSRGSAIQLRLLDQFPISADEEIEVTLTKKGGAEVNANNGELTWNLNLAPGAVRQLGFTFEVVYPKNMDLKLNYSQRRERAARFSY